MIHIDPRSGSGELLPLFLAHRAHPQAQHSHLPAGDFCFTISGPDGPTLLGIERKTLTDFISSHRTARLSEQIPKMLDHYARHSYIVIEGIYKVNRLTGSIEVPRTVNGKRQWVGVSGNREPIPAEEIDGVITTITEKTPIKIWRTDSPEATVDWVVNKAHWGETDWKKHHSHEGIHVPAPYVQVGKASDVRRTAFSIRDIGWERSWEVEQRFKTIEEMVNAPVEDWMKIPGFGKALSMKIYNRLRGKNQ